MTAPEKTNFIDKNNINICVGDTVRLPCDCNNETHGDWCDYTIEKAPGGYKFSYLISEKGQRLPVGYTSAYMSDMALDEELADHKGLLWKTGCKQIDVWEVIKQSTIISPEYETTKSRIKELEAESAKLKAALNESADYIHHLYKGDRAYFESMGMQVPNAGKYRALASAIGGDDVE